MSPSLFALGLCKLAFGVLVGALGLFVASRLLGKLMRWGSVDDAMREGNVAAGVLKGAALIALGLLVKHAVEATFTAVDLTFRGQAMSASVVLYFGVYGLVHVTFSFVVGSLVLALGALLFGHLTRGVDEMDEIRKGNVAPAIVLGAVLVVMALVTGPGLQTSLDGLLPLPSLGRDEALAP